MYKCLRKHSESTLCPHVFTGTTGIAGMDIRFVLEEREMSPSSFFCVVYFAWLIANRARKLTSFDEIKIDIYSFFRSVQFNALHKP